MDHQDTTTNNKTRKPRGLNKLGRFLSRKDKKGTPAIQNQPIQERDEDERDHETDRPVAVALHLGGAPQVIKEDKTEKRTKERKERRMWYDYYLRPYSMVVTDADLVSVKEFEDNDEKTAATSAMDSGAFTIDDSYRTTNEIDDSYRTNEIDDSINTTASLINSSYHNRTTCSSKKFAFDTLLEDDDDDMQCLRLPTEGRNLVVDGTCALCLDDYCTGDEVVWSSCPDCNHVFHKECFLEWASKGKKRCPVCRNWFVPGKAIEKQMKNHGEAWTTARAEMERAEELVQQQ